MFVPNLRCKIRQRVSTDAYGKPVYSAAKSIACGVVRLLKSSKRTSVRTDSSASRGSAHEDLIDAKILVPANVAIGISDVVNIMGYTMIVRGVFPRHAMAGRLDHWQVDLEIIVDDNTSSMRLF